MLQWQIEKPNFHLGPKSKFHAENVLPPTRKKSHFNLKNLNRMKNKETIDRGKNVQFPGFETLKTVKKHRLYFRPLQNVRFCRGSDVQQYEWWSNSEESLRHFLWIMVRTLLFLNQCNSKFIEVVVVVLCNCTKSVINNQSNKFQEIVHKYDNQISNIDPTQQLSCFLVPVEQNPDVVTSFMDDLLFIQWPESYYLQVFKIWILIVRPAILAEGNTTCNVSATECDPGTICCRGLCWGVPHHRLRDNRGSEGSDDEMDNAKCGNGKR